MSAKRREEPPAEPEPAPEEAPRATEEGGLEELERLAREREEYLQSWKRAAADYQNLRRRVASDIEAAVARSLQGLLHELLLSLDYLDLALAIPCRSQDAQDVHAGIALTRDALLQTLERHGVRPVPEGGRFDAAVHQAVASVETDEVPPGQVVETLRRGWTQGGQILRPAQVKVSAAPADVKGEEPS